MSYFEQNMPFVVKLRGQSNYSIVFIFVSFEAKGYYCVVPVGQLIFDCRSYCGLSRRMQGEPEANNSFSIILRELQINALKHKNTGATVRAHTRMQT